MSDKKLYRSRSNKIIAGVLAGLADYFGMDPTVVRVIYCALSLLTAGFPGLLLYIIMLVIVPMQPE